MDTTQTILFIAELIGTVAFAISGVLVAAEKLLGDETVYRMLSLTVDQTEPTAAEFTLPDGTFLW